MSIPFQPPMEKAPDFPPTDPPEGGHPRESTCLVYLTGSDEPFVVEGTPEQLVSRILLAQDQELVFVELEDELWLRTKAICAVEKQQQEDE